MDYPEREREFIKFYKLKVGDEVVVRLKAYTKESGWNNSWNDRMTESVGSKFKIIDICSSDGRGITLNFKGGAYRYPYFILNPAKKLKRKVG